VYVCVCELVAELSYTLSNVKISLLEGPIFTRLPACVCMCVCVRKKERERERERDGDRWR